MTRRGRVAKPVCPPRHSKPFQPLSWVVLPVGTLLSPVAIGYLERVAISPQRLRPGRGSHSRARWIRRTPHATIPSLLHVRGSSPLAAQCQSARHVPRGERCVKRSERIALVFFLS